MPRRKEKIDVLDLNPLAVTGLFMLATGLMLGIYALLWLFGRDWMVMSFDELWMPDASIGEAMGRVWFIFVWGVAVTAIVGAIFVAKGEYREHEPATTFFKGIWISLNAGLFEELMYRWMRFFSAMVILRFMDVITFGFVSWIFTEALLPLANFMTFGALETQLLGPEWLLGAAILSANGSFREAHKENGVLAYVNSWFGGMLLFWLMFNYGLLAAIVAHVLYDIAIFTTKAIASAFQPGLRYATLWR